MNRILRLRECKTVRDLENHVGAKINDFGVDYDTVYVIYNLNEN